MIRVLLADDHPVVRSGYQRLLEQTGEIRVVAEAGDGDAAWAAFVATPTDVLVTDLSMPGGGLPLIARVTQRGSASRVLVFSMHDSAAMVARAMAAGAHGYVSKGSAPECLIEAVRALNVGRRFLSPDLAAPGVGAAPAETEAERLAELSLREFETFRLLAQGHSVDDCARELKLSPKTVSNQQTLIKEKLGVATLAALVHLAIRNGVIGSPRDLGGHHGDSGWAA